MQLRHLHNTLRHNRWLATLVLILALAGLQWLQQRTQLPGGGADVPVDGVSGQPRLVDGDSFHLGSDEVRLVGIDAPEGRQACTAVTDNRSPQRIDLRPAATAPGRALRYG